MKVYVAGKLTDRAIVKDVMKAIRDLGHQITFDWTVRGSVADRPDLRASVADSEIYGVQEANCLVVVLPGGRGTHVELGAALARGKSVYMLHLEEDSKDEYEYECVFYYHKLVKHFYSVYHLLDHLRSD
ncbi:MAG: nucleoside 2-deoxyribosyltransferase [Gammaproteobacteria bacterium]|nr:nucleoside 2-deoxyribosyltransferase [Gammaproteobacteria bacterium]